MVKIHDEHFGEAMEYLHKAKKYMKKACELIEEGDEGSRRGGGRMSRRISSRFEDDWEDED